MVMNKVKMNIYKELKECNFFNNLNHNILLSDTKEIISIISNDTTKSLLYTYHSPNNQYKYTKLFNFILVYSGLYSVILTNDIMIQLNNNKILMGKYGNFIINIVGNNSYAINTIRNNLEVYNLHPIFKTIIYINNSESLYCIMYNINFKLQMVAN